jgi:hypothetical protein
MWGAGWLEKGHLAVERTGAMCRWGMCRESRSNHGGVAMKPTIELSMIVKNGGAALARCLGSARPFVDRILIGDTGSTDDTVEIARRLGAEMISIPWEQDFAQARNLVLEQAQCDWILVLDADEMLDGWSGRRIRELTQGPVLPEVGAFENWRWNYVRDPNTRLGERLPRKNPGVLEAALLYPAYVLTPTTRVFRRQPGLYYEGCVYETILGRLEAVGLKAASADFVVHHFGYAEDAGPVREKKNEAYQEMGKKKLADQPADAQTLFELGLGELEHFRRPTEALGYFERAYEADDSYAAAWLFAGVCLIRLGRLDDAMERLERAGRLGLRSGVYYQALGDAHFHAERFAEARAAYTEVERMGEASPASRAKLGAAEVRMGEVERGICRMRAAVESDPGFGELYDILAAGALLGGKVELAAQTAEARLTVGKPDGFHFQLAAALRAQLGDAAGAQAILERGRAAV